MIFAINWLVGVISQRNERPGVDELAFIARFCGRFLICVGSAMKYCNSRGDAW